MRSWTLEEITAKIEQDLDLQEETFIEPDELTEIINAGIDEAENTIHAISEDYFLTSDTLALIPATAAYNLPSDIFANKIRTVWFVDGKYTIKRAKTQKQIEALPFVQSDEDFQYLLKNTAGVGPQMVIYPTPIVAGTLTRWYLRNATRLVDATDTCDIPEFVSFVIAYSKEQCLAKENGGVAPTIATAKTEQARALMVETLTGMVPDGVNLIELDASHYEEHA